MALLQYLPRKHQTSLFLLLFLTGGSAYSQSSLSLASGTAVQGGSVSLNLSLSASTASALQWTLSYTAANVTSVSVAAGPALTAAGKTIQCSSGVGARVCLASGMNSTTIANGVVAVVTATLAPATSSGSIPIAVGSTIGSLGDGSAVAVSGTGGAITVQGWLPADTTAPSVPTGLSCTAMSSSQINLAWTASTDNTATTGYKVFRAGGQIATVTGSTTYQNIGLTAGTAYAYTVSAFDAANNNSVQGSSVSATTQAPTLTLTSLTCNPTTLGQNASATCIVTLSNAAPAGGASVTLANSNPTLTVPASVTVAAAVASAAFTATTTTISGDQSATVTATLSGVSRTATLSLLGSPAPLTGTSIWNTSTVPSIPWNNDAPATLGVKFRSDVSGTVTGIRFYKGAGNNGTHTGLLYSSGGTPLAQATFSGETASGWQQANFSIPVSIAANTTYVAAFFSTSGFALNLNHFTSSGTDSPPLHALRSGVDGLNGIYIYGGTPQFPTNTYADANYWVDIAFSAPPPPTGSSIWNSSTMPAIPWNNDAPATLGVKFRSDVSGSVTGIRFYKGAGNNGTHTGLLYSSGGTPLAQATFSGETASGWQQVNFSSPVSIAANTTYVAAFFSTSGYAYTVNHFTTSGTDSPPLHALQSGVDGPNGVYMFGGTPQFPSNTYSGTNYWVDVAFSAGGTPVAPSSLWSNSTVPAIPWNNDAPVTLGVKFRSDVSGSVTGIRFYKGAGNNGTHTGLLYSSSGTPLAQATFSGETASGWQQVTFSSPVSIAANTTYVAALFSTSGYAYTVNHFASSGTDSPPLHALRSGVDGPNGVYMFGGTPQFPSNTYSGTNYWVDLLFTAN